MTIWIIACPLTAFILLFIWIRNGMIAKQNCVEESFGKVDVKLRRRYDLIPNLVNAAQQYAKHEAPLLEKVVSLRTKALEQDLSPEEKVVLDNEMSQSIGRLLTSIKNYPEVRLNEHFLHLQRVLDEVDAQISVSRCKYNATVIDYNTSIQVFPNNLVSFLMGLDRKNVFVIPERESESVNIRRMFINS